MQPGFLQEADGAWSCMRLLCVVSMGAAVVFGGITLLVPKAASVGVTVTGMFLGAAIGGKVGQKALEKSPAPPQG